MLKRHVATGTTKLAIVAVAALLSCCASLSEPPPSTADKVLRDYARALSDGEGAAAYALMSPDYRARVSFETWQKNLADNPQEASDASRRLGRVRGLEDVHALQRDARDPLKLVQHDRRWYIASEPIELYDQSTPRAALRSFVAAFQRKRYDVILRLMPEADKESVTSESLTQRFGHAARNDVARMLSQLAPNLDAEIEVHGDHATMPYAEHRHVQFVLESGRWRIREPQ
jgi:type IV pilus biogenesis protein CpaD/CtpE